MPRILDRSRTELELLLLEGEQAGNSSLRLQNRLILRNALWTRWHPQHALPAIRVQVPSRSRISCGVQRVSVLNHRPQLSAISISSGVPPWPNG
jgi:hypothetical protein